MIKNKKAAIAFEKLVGALIAIAVAVALLIVVWNIRSGTGELTAKIDTFADPACKTAGQLKHSQGISFEDKDGDLRSDFACDICVIGSNDKDADGDGVPDDCDTDSANAKKGFCEDKKQEDCSKSKCCKKDGKCGPGGKGTLNNIGTDKKPLWQCKIA
jgi:hypothetical protein